MKLRRIKAVFKKQMMDTAYNRGTLILFLAYPLLTGIITFAASNSSAALKASLVIYMASLYTGIMPMLSINTIIREDINSNSLRMLIMSTVKPFEYLIGINAFTLFIAMIAAFIFGLLGGFGGFELLLFTGILMAGMITTLLLGSAMAMQGASNMGAGSLIIIVSLLNGLIPVFGMLNKSVLKISQFLYIQQISGLLGDLFGNFYGNLWYRFLIIGVNFAAFLILFIVSYKKSRFYGEK